MQKITCINKQGYSLLTGCNCQRRKKRDKQIKKNRRESAITNNKEKTTKFKENPANVKDVSKTITHILCKIRFFSE